MRSARGISTVETLVALGLIGPILAILTFQIHRSLSLSATISSYGMRITSITRALERIHLAIEHTDSHTLTIPPRIHLAGQIKFTDGSENQILNSGTLAPANDSDAITSIFLEPRDALSVNSINSSLVVSACPSFTRITSDDYTVQGFIGISPDGLVELNETGSKTTLPVLGCKTLRLIRTKSMSVPIQSPDLSPITVRQLIPIRDHYTLYVDRYHTLRYLGHRGEQNIENQQLASGISLTLTQTIDPTYKLYSVTGKISPIVGKNVSFSILGNAYHSTHYNLLLNMP